MGFEKISTPFSVREIQVTDEFWLQKMELVRKEVIPYQWEALNDRVEGAAPSYCMHNFRVAAKMNQERRRQGKAFREPEFSKNGWFFEAPDPKHPDDQFYGFVFQDSDFYKWVEAVAYSLCVHPDEELEKTADEAIALVGRAQLENGYLDTLYIISGIDKAFTNLRDHHELYCLGHLVEAAVAYYEATGKRRLLEIACKYADYVFDLFGAEIGKKKGYPGHEVAEMALVRLYHVTGDGRYLTLAKYFIDERGRRPYYFDLERGESTPADRENHAYHQANRPVREQDEATGHAVRAVYLYAGMAAVAKETKDAALLEACERLFRNIADEKLYITGGIGATHMGEAFSFPFDLPNDTAYAETCASIGLMFFARRMLEIAPKSEYADVCERALYNTVLAGMALDGKSFFYVNPLAVDPEACHKDERKFHVKPVRQKWFGCACCPPNIARLVSSLGAYGFTRNESTLFVHLYLGSRFTMESNGISFPVEIDASILHRDNARITFPEGAPEFTLALRKPSWCQGFAVEGAESAEIREQDGYWYITKSYAPGEQLLVQLPMEVQLWQCHPMVGENQSKIAVSMGPVVYCLEEKDQECDLRLLTVNARKKPERKQMTVAGEQVLAIELSGGKMAMPQKGAALYTPYAPEQRTETTLCYIPYYVWANRGENRMQVWTTEQSQ